MPTYSHLELREVLSHQIQRRKDEMTPEIFKLAEQLLDKFLDFEEFDEHPVYLPALLVLPFGAVPFKRQLEAIRYKPLRSDLEPQPAYSFLNPDNIVDLGEAGVVCPYDEPYIILHVDDGLATKGDSPEAAAEILSGYDLPRSPITVSQGIALPSRRSWLLDSHNIHLAGSRIKDEKTGELYALDFWVYAGQIKMKRDSAKASDPRWATPSYCGVITL
jgi:hypothetical protein